MAALPQPYETRLVAVSATSVNQQRINYGSRVLLPSSVLDDLCRITMVYPLQFEIITPGKKRVYAAVLEFNAQAGSVVLPDWMFQHLGLSCTMVVKVQSCSLPPGLLVKLRPHQKALVMFENPRHILELRLSQYPVLTRGTTIVISYVDHEFQLDLVDIIDMKQELVDGILTVRADGAPVELKVDFERPLDMPPSPPDTPISAVASPTGANVIGASSPTGVQFQPFNFRPPTLTEGPKVVAAVPPLKHQPGQSSSSSSGPNGSKSAAESEPPIFTSAGRTLRGILPSENQPNEASGSSPSAPPAARPSPEELRAMRLKAFGGGGHS
ncbi:ubiquitin fusion degradation protein, putative [Leishmania tarentolae]|uniref:Ubiquitin fusion degradation protein, putative n=1 Tax=Leishmania tarentolae TaxID=5689 RepID=A0A640KX80_LEITA|nr:ubiquitin fusion degradation protein, putative [Leishmania tarentolae]